MVDTFRESLLEEKTLNFLLKGANIIQVDASQPNPEEDASRE